MRNKFVVFALLFVSATGALWGQFWKNYTEKDRQAVAQAYWLAGKQYQAIGKADKGKEFMQLARTIDPQLDPSALKEESVPSTAELLARGNASTIGGGTAEVPVQSLNSFFLRFLGSLLDKDSAAASGFLDGSVYLSKHAQEISRSEARTALERFFASAPLAGKTPSDLYSLNSVIVSRASPTMRAAWGDAYALRVDANVDYSQYFDFWEMKQQYLVHNEGGEWHIFAIGQAEPPLTWKPQEAGPVTNIQPVSSDTAAQASKGVVDAFSACLAEVLRRDADGAMRSMSSNVTFLRLRQTVTSEELKMSLEGSFDNADFGSAQVADAVDLNSAFVEQTQSPVPGVSAPVYSLSIRAKMDLSKALPFWSTYQRYYFVNDNGQWKIFALL